MVYIRISDRTVNFIYRWSKQDSIIIIIWMHSIHYYLLLYFQNWCYCCHDIFMSEYLTVLIFHMFVERKVQNSMQYAGCWLLVDTTHNHVNQRIRTRTRINNQDKNKFLWLDYNGPFDGSILSLLVVMCVLNDWKAFCFLNKNTHKPCRLHFNVMKRKKNKSYQEEPFTNFYSKSKSHFRLMACKVDNEFH